MQRLGDALRSMSEQASASLVKAVPPPSTAQPEEVYTLRQRPGPVRRYMVFAHFDHYPAGGWGDYFGSFDSLGEARILAGACLRKMDDADIVDRDTGEVFAP